MIVDKGGLDELLNIKNPFRKIGKRTFPFYFFLVVFFTNYALNVSFIVTHHIASSMFLTLVFLILGFLTLMAFGMVFVKDPGYLKP